MKTLKIDDLRRELIHILTEGYDCTAHRAETVLREIEDRLETKGLVFDWDAALKDAYPLITVDNTNHVTRDVLALGAPVTIPDAAIACGYPDLFDALENDTTRAVVFAVMAQMRYEYADAMLKAREGV